MNVSDKIPVLTEAVSLEGDGCSFQSELHLGDLSGLYWEPLMSTSWIVPLGLVRFPREESSSLLKICALCGTPQA